MTRALVVGAGPAGLMAADTLASAGMSVTVAEAKPSPARKFLMAGKSGLNLTKNEEQSVCLEAYGAAASDLRLMIQNFGPQEIMTWANRLDQPVFTGSTGRVFPKSMKASPLLRAWLARLDSMGVHLNRRWRWTGWDDAGQYRFDTPDGPQVVSPDVAVLACGGASWARLGSDGMWSSQFSAKTLAPFAPANVGFKVAWSDYMTPHFGKPLKGVMLHAWDKVSRGELVLSRHGLEGGGIYTLSPQLREGAPLTLDLMPNVALSDVQSRLSRPRGKASRSNHLRKTLKLDPLRQALLREFTSRSVSDKDLPLLIKALPVPLDGPRPIDEAISTAGGLKFDALDSDLMMKDHPGTFAAGEMLDWEAPTGGYLITASLATGRWAGQAAVRWVQANDGQPPV